MALIETWVNQDVKQPVKVRYLDGNVFSADNSGNLIGVNLFDDGSPAVISGAVSANVIRSDGVTVPVGGSYTGNKATVVLPQAAYAVPGVISIVIKVTDNSVVTTIAAIVANVYMSSTDSIVDPGSIIPSIENLIATINAAVATIPPDYSGLVEAFISRGLSFDLVAMYGTHTNTTHNGVTYSWSGDTCTVSGKATALSFDNILNIGLPSAVALVPFMGYVEISGTYQNVRVELFEMSNGSIIESKLLTETGTVSFTTGGATSLIARLSVANGYTASGTIRVKITSQNSLPWGTHAFNNMAGGTDLNTLKNGGYLVDNSYTYPHEPPVKPSFLMVYELKNTAFQICYPYSPSTRGVFMRTKYVDGTWSDWVSISMSGTNISSFAVNGNIDIDSVRTNGFYLIYDAYTYTNLPFTGSAGFLFVYSTLTAQLQMCIPFNPNCIYMRRNLNNGSWSEWLAAGGGNVYNVTNNYSFPKYSQTVTLNASPSITSDTNNYLAPSGDTTDRTADILAMLTANGICRLGAGDYYVSNLEMPDGSSIIGSGYTTRIRLAGTSDGYAIKMGSRCLVQDVRIAGSEASDMSFGSTIGGRHGILWEGDYTENSTAPNRSMVNNVWIHNFTGGGITCYDTGYGTSNALEVSNAYVFLCWAGVNISYWSEYHKFTNVRAGDCRIGCVNNGGNNVFTNCDFSGNREIALLMDNSQGQSPNNTHGSCVGCVFNHTAHSGTANSGVGIEITNCSSGFIFSGCQVFYSKINLTDSSGIVISSTNFGLDNCNITVSGGGGVLFSDCMVGGSIPVSVSNNANVRFVNCYQKSGSAFNP